MSVVGKDSCDNAHRHCFSHFITTATGFSGARPGQHFGKNRGDGFRARWRLVRLWQAKVVYHHPGIGNSGIATGRTVLLLRPRYKRQLPAGMLRRRGQTRIDGGIGGDRSKRFLLKIPGMQTVPLVEAQSAIGLDHCGSGRIDRLDQPERRWNAAPYTSNRSCVVAETCER